MISHKEGRTLAMTARRLTMKELRDQAPGSAYVDSVVLDGSETVVTLRYPGGHLVEVTMPWALAEGVDAPPPLVQVFAVHVFNVFGVDCAAIGNSAAGPQRTAISLEKAVALAASGVHTVFFIRDPANLSPENKRRRGT